MLQRIGVLILDNASSANQQLSWNIKEINYGLETGKVFKVKYGKGLKKSCQEDW
jgi:hypothetical protein